MRWFGTQQGQGFQLGHDERRPLGGGVGLRHVVDVAHRGADLLVTHIRLHVADRVDLDGQRAVGVPEVAEAERVRLLA
jgi:hypothetical protein